MVCFATVDTGTSHFFILLVIKVLFSPMDIRL